MPRKGIRSSRIKSRCQDFISNASAVDLFCGIGGLTHGLIKAGIPVNAGIDIDASCKDAYEINNNTQFIEKDISKLTSDDVLNLYPEGHTKILVGCAPCQPFSAYARTSRSKDNEHRWKLLYSFTRIIRSIKPEIVSMENVPLLTKHEPFTSLLNTLEKMQYRVKFHEVHCESYGIPQKRRRLVLLASKIGDIDLIPPTHGPNDIVTVKQAIGKLDPIEAGEISMTDTLHRAQHLSSLNKKRLSESLPGGTWRDWDPDLLCPCHKRTSGSSYASVYGRMSWDEPSPTITTQFFNYGSGRFGHPEQLRALSLREGAILQSFPDNYVFVKSKGQIKFTKIATHIGNAVPVRLGEIIGISIRKHLEGFANV